MQVSRPGVQGAALLIQIFMPIVNAGDPPSGVIEDTGDIEL